jgi:hypothetical protein
MVDTLHGYAIGDPPDSTSRPGLVRTTDGGAIWSVVVNDLPEGDIQHRFRTDFVSPDLGWTKVWNDGIFKTTDGGQSWTRVHAEPTLSTLFFFNDSIGFYTSHIPPGLFKSTDGGVTWRQTFQGPPFQWVRWAPGGKELWAGRDTLYKSSDMGETWQAVLSNRGLGGCGTFQDASFPEEGTGLVAGMCLVLGQESDPLAVPTAEDAVPLSVELDQNYPNPFNPATVIRFSVPARSHVTLVVFNVLGQKVAELINGDIEAGAHEVKFDAAGLGSGVYFYRLQATGYTLVNSMMVLK